MRTIWHSLAWKEWHEHKWKLAAVTAIFAGVSAIGAISDIRRGDLEFDPMTPLIALLYSSVPLSLFIAATAASGERSKNTLSFYQSLPVPMWKAGSWKLFYGLMTCLVAILITIAVYNLWYLYSVLIGRDVPTATLNEIKHVSPLLFSNRPLLNWNLYIAFAICVIAGSVFVWVAAVGVNRRSEVAAGGLGLLAIILWWTAIFVGAHWFFPNSPTLPFWPAGAILAASPGGLPILTVNKLMPNEVGFVVPLAIAIMVHAGLATWFSLRFGRTGIGVHWSPKAHMQNVTGQIWLRPPRRSQLSAIVWKQTREITPVVVAGVIGISSVVLIQIAIRPDFLSRPHMLDFLFGVTIWVGLFVALAAGISIFDRDLGPRLNTFWRSRPINPDLWFWSKFATGLAVVMLIFSAPPIAATLWSLHADPANRYSSDDLSVFLFQAAIYSAAMAAICLIRQTIYAAILGVGLVAVIVVIPMIWIDPQRLRLQSVIVAVSTIATVACTLVAWLAVRYDWGENPNSS